MAPPFRYAQRPPHNTVPPWHMEARKRHVVNDWKGAKIWLLARCGPCWPVIKLTRGAPRRCAPRNDEPKPVIASRRRSNPASAGNLSASWNHSTRTRPDDIDAPLYRAAKPAYTRVSPGDGRQSPGNLMTIHRRRFLH